MGLLSPELTLRDLVLIGGLEGRGKKETREQQKKKCRKFTMGGGDWTGRRAGASKSSKGGSEKLPLRLSKLEGASSPLFNIKLGERGIIPRVIPLPLTACT